MKSRRTILDYIVTILAILAVLFVQQNNLGFIYNLGIIAVVLAYFYIKSRRENS